MFAAGIVKPDTRNAISAVFTLLRFAAELQKIRT